MRLNIRKVNDNETEVEKLYIAEYFKIFPANCEICFSPSISQEQKIFLQSSQSSKAAQMESTKLEFPQMTANHLESTVYG